MALVPLPMNELKRGSQYLPASQTGPASRDGTAHHTLEFKTQERGINNAAPAPVPRFRIKYRLDGKRHMHTHRQLKDRITPQVNFFQ